MKLATALTQRGDLQRRLSELGKRLNNNAKVQADDTPAEEPRELLAEADGVLKALENLITRINMTNSLTKLGDTTLTQLLAERDCLKLRVSMMREFLNNASAKVERYSAKEIRIISTVPVSELQKMTDEYSAQLRRTEEKIQQLNWTTELL